MDLQCLDLLSFHLCIQLVKRVVTNTRDVTDVIVSTHVYRFILECEMTSYSSVPTDILSARSLISSSFFINATRIHIDILPKIAYFITEFFLVVHFEFASITAIFLISLNPLLVQYSYKYYIVLFTRGRFNYLKKAKQSLDLVRCNR